MENYKTQQDEIEQLTADRNRLRLSVHNALRRAEAAELVNADLLEALKKIAAAEGATGTGNCARDAIAKATGDQS